MEILNENTIKLIKQFDPNKPIVVQVDTNAFSNVSCYEIYNAIKKFCNSHVLMIPKELEINELTEYEIKKLRQIINEWDKEVNTNV